MRDWLVRALVSLLAVGPLALAGVPMAAAHEDPNVPIPGPSVAEPSTVPSYSPAQQAAGEAAGETVYSPPTAPGEEGSAFSWVPITGGMALALVLGAGAVWLGFRRRRPAVRDPRPNADSIEPTEPVEAELQRLVEAAYVSEADQAGGRLLTGSSPDRH